MAIFGVVRRVENTLRCKEVAVDASCRPTVGVQAARGCPLLWYFIVDDRLQGLNDVECTVVGYADGITILISGKFEGIISEMMQGPCTFLKGDA